MLQELKTYIAQHQLFTEQDTLLVAVSGGIDSSVLLHLLTQAGYHCAVAHCNFRLRGQESDGDQQFVAQLTEGYGIPFHTIGFNTAKVAQAQQVSIQMAARDLRYNWFAELCREHGFKQVAIAHNQDDVVETFLINMARGTGIKGLTGIKAKNGRFVRPMLFASRQQIVDYAQANAIGFREDSSNASTKYSRNKIRHQIIPAFEQINPAFRQTIIENIARLQEAHQLVSHQLKKQKKDCAAAQENGLTVDIEKLLAQAAPQSLLFDLLSVYGFNSRMVADILATASTQQSGKVFYSDTHRLLRDRDRLIVQVLAANDQPTVLIAQAQTTAFFNGQKLQISIHENDASLTIERDPLIALLDASKLSFPLTLRHWVQGDTFRPLGMKGNKKLSDFFIDAKLSLFEKEQAWVVVSGNQIVWVAGYRIDDRYKLTDHTQQVLRIAL